MKSASQFGVFEIAFTQPIMNIPEIIDFNSLEFAEQDDDKNYRLMSSEQSISWKPALIIEVIPSGSQEKENVGISWSIVSMSQSGIKIKVFFEQALFISFSKPD